LICFGVIFFGWWRVVWALATSPERLAEAIAFGIWYIPFVSAAFALGASVIAYIIVKIVQHTRSRKER
jgi:ABC-type thiamin/hydroxymethylpyrimidine transport system permease subunit